MRRRSAACAAVRARALTDVVHAQSILDRCLSTRALAMRLQSWQEALALVSATVPAAPQLRTSINDIRQCVKKPQCATTCRRYIRLRRGVMQETPRRSFALFTSIMITGALRLPSLAVNLVCCSDGCMEICSHVRHGPSTCASGAHL